MTAVRPLDAERIREMLRDEPFVRRLIVRDSVRSTNDEIRVLATEGAGEGCVVVAERQTTGRGRLGRPWFSPPGLGLYVSVLFRPSAPVRELTRWTLAAAVAACEACRQVGGFPAEIEWPNDIVWEGRKLGGILTEMRTGGPRATQVVVGTGLNVLHDRNDFEGELATRATSLRLAGGIANADRERLLVAYLRELALVARHLERGDWRAIADRWEAMAPGARGRGVRVKGSAGTADYEGITAGLDPMGALLVRRANGVEESVRTAESVLPLKGRVPCC